jgi:hypothetical protein
VLLRTTLMASWLALTAQAAMVHNSTGGERLANELAGAYVECGTYFQLVAQCIRPQDPDTAAAYDHLRDETFAAAVIAGRSIGLLDETAKARAQMAGQEAMKAIAGNCMNISILYQRYKDAYTVLVRDPAGYAERYVKPGPKR